MASKANKRRNSLLPPPQSDLLDETPIIEDEEAERRGRLKLHKRQSIGHGVVGAALTPNAQGAQAVQDQALSGYSASQLAELYSTCMKLSAENKINAKNAFHLQLIDYMAEMMKTKKSSDMDNFQAASCALDASAKIYAYRVDSVHSDTLKLAGGVGKSVEEQEKENRGGNDMEDDNVNGDDFDETKKKEKKKKKRAATIEKNLNNIDINKFDLEFDVDPLFKKTSTQFDSGGGGGQFLCSLYLRDESCQLLLDSDAFLNMVSEPLLEDDCQELEESAAINLPKIEDNLTICPSFATFSFKNWSVENEDPAFLNLSIRSEDGDDNMDEDKDEEQHHVFDVNAPPVEDLDLDNDAVGFVNDDDDFDNVVGDNQTEASAPNNRGLGLELMANVKQKFTSIPNEYSYFDNGRLGAWAGPKHWKFKAFAKPSLPQVGNAGENPKKKAKEAIGPLSFEDLFVEDKEMWNTVEKTMTVPKKPIKLQNKTMVNWNEDRFLLPSDLHYKGKDFAKLFFSPEILVTSKGAAVVPESVDDSINEYDFDNANDADEFCPSLPTHDGDDNQTAYFPSQSALPTQTQENDFLVAAPNRVEKVQIGYAKQAKKVDMRRLKAVEWSILQNSSGVESNKENDKTKMNDADEKLELKDPISFGDMYKNLTETKLMSSKMVENLSVPLAFVALLHLCNERGLALEGLSDFSDFHIAQG